MSSNYQTAVLRVTEVRAQNPLNSKQRKTTVSWGVKSYTDGIDKTIEMSK